MEVVLRRPGARAPKLKPSKRPFSPECAKPPLPRGWFPAYPAFARPAKPPSGLLNIMDYSQRRLDRVSGLPSRGSLSPESRPQENDGPLLLGQLEGLRSRRGY
jgi:hypothetical protein